MPLRRRKAVRRLVEKNRHSKKSGVPQELTPSDAGHIVGHVGYLIDVSVPKDMKVNIIIKSQAADARRSAGEQASRRNVPAEPSRTDDAQ